MKRHTVRAFSTTAEIVVSDHILPGYLLDVYDFLDGADKTFSRFRTDSELSWLNQQINKEVMVSNEMFDVLQLAYQYYEATEGIFHPGILSFLEKEGYAQSIEHTVEYSNEHQPKSIQQSMISAIRHLMDKNVNISNQPPYMLSPEHHKVTLFRKIDLGGIAKGWIVDQAVNLLGDFGYGFINIGGDIRVFGELPRAVHIGIEDPSNPEKVVGAVYVADGGLATSSTTKRKWQTGGKWYHHLIDPHTGKSAETTMVSATVLAPTCTEADIWAKTVLILGMEKGIAKIRENGQQAILIDSKGSIVKVGAGT